MPNWPLAWLLFQLAESGTHVEGDDAEERKLVHWGEVMLSAMEIVPFEMVLHINNTRYFYGWVRKWILKKREESQTECQEI